MFSNRFNWSYLVSAGIILSAALSNCTMNTTDQELEINDPWARAGTVDTPGAVYLVVVNQTGGQETLLGGSSPRCAAVELHETIEMEDGVMGMQPVEGGIPIPDGERAALQPGGYHFMCLGKTEAFEAGSTLPFELLFQASGSVELDIPIQTAE